MKLKTSLALLLCLISLNTYAQKLTIEWGPTEELPKHNKNICILGQYKDKFYVLRASTDKGGQYIDVYDKDNKILNSSQITVNTEGKETYFKDLLLVDGQPILFYTFYNSKLQKQFLFGNKLGPDGHAIGDAFMIDEIQNEKKKKDGNFTVLLSHDSSKILVFRFEPYEKKANQRFNLKVLNRDLGTIWEKHVTLPFEDADVTISDGTVTGNGKVYILAKFQHEQSAVKHGMPTFKYYIYGFSAEKDKKQEEYEIGLGDKIIKSIGFKTDRENNLLCAGFYSNKDIDKYNGSFFFKLGGKNNSVLAKGAQDFSKDFIAKFVGDSKAQKADGLSGATAYVPFLKSILTRKDGGFTVISEISYNTYLDGGATYFSSNAIFVSKINADGSLAWNSMVPKYQNTKNDGGEFNSYSMAEYGDKLFFIYNDDPKNLAITEYRKMERLSSTNKSIAVLAEIDAEGKLTREELFSNKEEGIILCPMMSILSKENQIRIYAQKKKDFKFGSISFE